MPFFWIVCLSNRWTAKECMYVYVHEYKFYFQHLSVFSPHQEALWKGWGSHRLWESFSFYSLSESLETWIGRAQRGQLWPENTILLKWHIPFTKTAMHTVHTNTGAHLASSAPRPVAASALPREELNAQHLGQRSLKGLQGACVCVCVWRLSWRVRRVSVQSYVSNNTRHLHLHLLLWFSWLRGKFRLFKLR